MNKEQEAILHLINTFTVLAPNDEAKQSLRKGLESLYKKGKCDQILLEYLSNRVDNGIFHNRWIMP